MRNYKKIVLSSLFLFTLGLSLTPLVVSAADPASGNYGLDATVQSANLDSPLGVTALKTAGGPTAFLTTRAGQIVGAILAFIGIIFLALMIYAGFLWMTAAGNEASVDKAKNLIIAAIIGLIIIFGAYAITAWIGTNLLK